MKEESKKEIAERFIDAHKHSNIEEWHLSSASESGKLLEVYDNLMGGLYGDIKTENDIDFVVEISKSDSVSANPIIFEWQDEQ